MVRWPCINNSRISITGRHIDDAMRKNKNKYYSSILLRWCAQCLQCSHNRHHGIDHCCIRRFDVGRYFCCCLFRQLLWLYHCSIWCWSQSTQHIGNETLIPIERAGLLVELLLLNMLYVICLWWMMAKVKCDIENTTFIPKRLFKQWPLLRVHSNVCMCIQYPNRMKENYYLLNFEYSNGWSVFRTRSSK